MSCTVGGFSMRALLEARVGVSTAFAAGCAVALAPRPFLLAFERLAGCTTTGSGCVSAFRFVLAGRLAFAAGSFAWRAAEEAPVRVPGIGAVVRSAAGYAASERFQPSPRPHVVGRRGDEAVPGSMWHCGTAIACKMPHALLAERLCRSLQPPAREQADWVALNAEWRGSHGDACACLLQPLVRQSARERKVTKPGSQTCGVPCMVSLPRRLLQTSKLAQIGCSELVVTWLSHELGSRRRDTHRVVCSRARNRGSGDPLTPADGHSKPATQGSALPCIMCPLQCVI